MSATGCRCPCGNVTFDVGGPPLFRMFCHCTICQRFTDSPFADIVVYPAASVGQPAEGSVDYATYKPPPNALRGKCAACSEPAIEQLDTLILPKLTMVPASMHHPDAALPGPVAHVFYDTRVADVDDALPKHQGFIPSQLAFVKHLLSARRKR